MPFWRMTETPSVAIRVVSTSRPRSGATTMRSMTAPMAVDPTAPPISATARPPPGTMPAAIMPENMPIMNTSGWANWITRRTVNASAKPTATTA